MSLIEGAKNFLGFHQEPTIRMDDVKRTYEQLPSFISRLPWMDFNEKHKCILLEDNNSLGVCFKITPISCEARPESMLQEIAKSISHALKNSIPCEKENPWILQVYAYKDSNLSQSYTEIEKYFSEERKKTDITKAHLRTLHEHLNYVSREGGIFHDNQVTNTVFRGGFLHVYAVLYRRKKLKTKSITRRTNLEEIVTLARKVSDQLRSCGMKISRVNGNEFSAWMRKWFNPNSHYENHAIYPDESKKPVGFDLAEQLFFTMPESFEEGWYFDGLPHKVITIQNMTTKPEIGHISAERKRGTDDKIFNLIDHLPESSVFVITVVMQAQSEVEVHLKNVHQSAIGLHAQADNVRKEVAAAEKLIADGDMIFPVVMNVYLRGSSLEDLHAKQAQSEVLLNSNGFKVIIDDELYPIDAYLRYLPMCYDFNFDRHNSYRSRYMPLSEISKLLPFYGRSRGTEHPGMVMFNRGGEPFFYDMMRDKTKNAHFLLLGETGTGKSNTLNSLILHDIALYNSRFVISDVGGTFDSLGDYCLAHGLTVNKVKIDPKNPISLNPFYYGLRVIEQIEALNTSHEEILNKASEKLLKEEEENKQKNSTSFNEITDDEPQDILGDMVLAALIMITGGEQKEEDTIRRSDRMLIMDAIIDAAYFVRNQKREQMIASDVVEAFERIAKSLDPMREQEKIRRAREMADAMRYFTKDPVSSRFFNSYGKPWPLVDVTIVDYGLFAKEGYEAQRSIAFAGCMNKLLSIAELNQKSNRPLKAVFDEIHIFACIPLLANILTRIAKTGRKLGLWLWLATQNLRDFAEGARRMLSQCEHWMCLALPPDEIDQIERFKKLTEEERTLFLSAQKEKGKYTEGVLLSPKVKSLFRNVPPRLYLAMAATDQDEKNQRALIMQAQDCSEIEAIEIIARDMMNIKSEVYKHA